MIQFQMKSTFYDLGAVFNFDQSLELKPSSAAKSCKVFTIVTYDRKTKECEALAVTTNDYIFISLGFVNMNGFK
jgi:hypothetical protein